MQTYARQGGTSAIFVHDDGLQLISEEEREKRVAFYADHNIGWVARPPHSSDANGFKRAGRFKKASNMNYGLNISNKTEDVLQAMITEKMSAEGKNSVTESEEDDLYHAALEKVLADDGRAWASGNIRVGEYILIVDSDTRVVSHRSSLHLMQVLMFHSLRTA